jgi:hypothetical protein
MAYELCALAGPRAVAARPASEAGVAAIGLPQGFALVPVTSAALVRLAGTGPPAGDAPWFAATGIEALPRRVSRAGPLACLLAEIFGGTGTQAMAVWRDGEIWLGPVITELGWPPADPAARPEWAINRALRKIGADRGQALDEFEALHLGRHRYTEDWHPVS